MDTYCVFLICAFQHQSDPKTYKCATLWWNVLLPTTGPVNKCKSMLWQIRREGCGTIVVWWMRTKRFFEVFFLFTWPGIQSTSLSPLPMPLYQCLHQRLSVFHREIKGEIYSFFRKNWKLSQRGGKWRRNHACDDGTRSVWTKANRRLHLITHTFGAACTNLRKRKRKCLTKNEVLPSFSYFLVLSSAKISSKIKTAK